jgi:hypothetical protein
MFGEDDANDRSGMLSERVIELVLNAYWSCFGPDFCLTAEVQPTKRDFPRDLEGLSAYERPEGGEFIWV